MLPGSADEHRWATIIGLSVAGECRLEAMWEMGDGKWEMGNGKWEMGNGKWEMENSRFIGVKSVAGECGFRN